MTRTFFLSLLVASAAFAQNPAFVGPYTRLGTQNPAARMDAGSVLRGALIMVSDGGQPAMQVYDGRHWSELPTATTAPMDLYVNGDGGVDTNDCATTTTACKTIQAAVDRIPYWVRHDVTVNVEAGAYVEDVRITGHRIGTSGSSSTAPAIFLQGSNNFLPVVGATGTTTSYSAPTAGATGYIEDNTKAWSPMQYTGGFLRMTSGTAAAGGQRSIIPTNTATQLAINRQLTGAAGGDTFVVETPSTSIEGTITVENITGSIDAQKGGVVIRRFLLGQSTSGPTLAVYNVPLASPTTVLTTTFTGYESYRPRAAVVLTEVQIAHGHADAAAIMCRSASCGLVGPNYISAFSRYTVYAKEATLDLGASLIENTYQTQGRTVYAEESRLLVSQTPSVTSGAPDIADFENLFPVLVAIGTTGYALEVLDVTAGDSINSIMLQGGYSGGTPGNYCAKLVRSSLNVLYYSCRQYRSVSGDLPAYGIWLTDRSYFSAWQLYAETTNTTARVESGSRLEVGSGSPSAGGIYDLNLDGDTYTWASIEALTPRYVQGVKGSQYLRE